MKRTIKRSFALLMTILMCLSLIPTMTLAASTANIDYVYGTGEHSNYIYNWGIRGETAVFLSQNAESFYADTTYEYLSSLTGGTGTADAPDSALYSELQTLMAPNHQNITTYSETKSLFQYTDCQNNGGAISSFYSGTPIGPSWDGTWNREHTWPNSKSNSDKSITSREEDIIMLRPTATTENSSRGNKAYGESDGYYDPNSVSGSTLNLRGDVARIVLYVYTRWGNTSDADGVLDYMWGSEGVIESKDVLLRWMADDPVDTWEMGRNDSVESITGTRNVFVDYPELAFQLFGETIPVDMVSPSYTATHEDHTLSSSVTAPTCTEEGYTTYTCSCGVSYVGNKLPATDHSFTDGACSVCNESEPTSTTWTLVTDASTLKAGDQIVIVAADVEKALSTTQKTSNRGAAEVTKDGSTVTFDEDTQVITLENGSISGTFAFNVGETGYLYASSSSSNQLKTNSTLDNNGSWLITIADNVATVTAQGGNTRNQMRYNSQSALFSCYGSNNSQQDIAIYALASEEPDCQHSYTASVTDPTCTEPGYTTYTCTYCEHTYKVDGDPATGHSFTNGACSVCNESEPTATTWTLVTDAATLEAGNQIVIVAAEYLKALSTVQNGNNRGTAEVTKDGNTVTFSEDTQVITLENGTISGTFAFNVENGYLYAASSSKNYLRTETPLSVNSSWKIEIESSGVATVTAQGSFTHNWLRYNSSNNIFSCYGDGQQNIVIYTLASEETPHEHKYNAVVTPPTCTKGGYTTYTCACKDSYVDDYTNALNHAFTIYTEKDGLNVANCDHGCGETDEKLGAPSWYLENGEIKGGEYTTGYVMIALYSKDGQLIAANFCTKGEERVFDGEAVCHFAAPEFTKTDIAQASKIKCFHYSDDYVPLRDAIKVLD